VTGLTIELLRKYSNALHTQYQLHGDYSISGRASYEAPTIEQMSTIREAHLAIIPIVKQLITTMQREAKLREALDSLYRAAADYEQTDTPALSRDLNKARAALRSSEYSVIKVNKE